MTALADRLNQAAFDALWGSSLVYNACWEDPAVDRVALGLQPGHRVLVITSGGCNALDYALCGPAEVHAVDANPRQGALLELKLAGIRALAHHDFFRIFGEGSHPAFADLYRRHLREQLSPFARRFWDRRAHWFSGRGPRPSLYFHGLSGLVARLMVAWIGQRPALRQGIEAVFAARDQDEQRAAWDRLEPLLFSRTLCWLLGRQTTMSLLGVPGAQTAEVEHAHSGGVAGFVRDSLGRVFRELPAATNYFWAVYLRGRYSATCCPEYLTAAGFAALKAGRVEAVRVHTGTVAGILRGDGPAFDRYVLLDHMDWMGAHRPDLLGDEWAQLLRRAAPEARAIWRSARPQPTYLDRLQVPGHGLLADRLRMQPELAAELHRRDRVGTYGGFHIADLAR